MSYLDLINYLIILTGGTKVTDEDSTLPEVGTMKELIDASSRELQTVGWWFNMEYSVLMIPDATTKEIAVASNILTIRSETRTGVVQRGSKLYDTINNTYQWDTPQTVRQVINLDWDYLPVSFQTTVKYAAGETVASLVLEDDQKALEQGRLFSAFYGATRKEHIKNESRNILNAPNNRYNRRRGINPFNVGG